MTQQVRNPRTGEYDYTFTVATDQDVAAACIRLRKGQLNWAAYPVSFRAQVLQRWKAELQERREVIIDALFRDTGRINETILEFEALCSTIDRWCKEAPEWLSEQPARQTSVPFIQVTNQDVAIPLVGVISPWNFPLLLSLIDAIPALLVGSAVAVKPSEVTPRFIEPLQASIDAVPELAAVLAYLSGAGPTGAALISHVDTICFTGSVATGRKVAEAAAREFIPAFLELGGKDAALVLEGADIERASAALAWGSMVNAGQVCLSIERVYVHESLFDGLVAKLAERLKSLRFCYGDDPKQGEVGPIIDERQAQLIQSHLDDALSKGASLICGGKIEKIGGGLWCQPTLVINVSPDMKIVCEETFGPILPVMKFKTEDEAVRLANDTPFGLSGAVFCNDRERARSVAKRLEAGGISINDCALTGMMHEGEKQSFKLSGIGGSRMGAASIRRFVRRKALLENSDLAWDPWWFHSS